MNKKSIITLLLVVAVAIAGYFIWKTTKSTSNNSEKYIIGCSTPLTGEGANYGRSTKEGIDLAVDELNSAKYLDKPIEIVYEDDKINPNDGINAVNKLVNSNKVPVIIGPFGSSVTLAIAPIVNKAKVVSIGASATADSIADAGDYVFRITPPNSRQGADVADFCSTKLNSKKAAIIFQNNDYGTTLKSSFEKQFTQNGGTVVFSEGVDLGIKDLRTQILKIKGTSPDVVFFPLHVAESGLLLKQSKELGLNAKFISCDGAMVQDLLTIAGNAAEGTYYTTLALGYGVSDNDIKKFNEAFKKKYSKEPDVYAAYYYEATKIVAKAIKEGGYDGDKIKDKLYAMSGENAYNGVTGKTSFDKNGEVNKSFYIYEVVNGAFTLYK